MVIQLMGVIRVRVPLCAQKKSTPANSIQLTENIKGGGMAERYNGVFLCVFVFLATAG